MTVLYRGTIAFDDDDLYDQQAKAGCDSAKRIEWYKSYWKTEKYKKYKREYMREWRKRKITR